MIDKKLAHEWGTLLYWNTDVLIKRDVELLRNESWINKKGTRISISN